MIVPVAKLISAGLLLSNLDCINKQEAGNLDLCLCFIWIWLFFLKEYNANYLLLRSRLHKSGYTCKSYIIGIYSSTLSHNNRTFQMIVGKKHPCPLLKGGYRSI